MAAATAIVNTTLGVSSWDFAYPTGTCPCDGINKNCSNNIFKHQSRSHSHSHRSKKDKHTSTAGEIQTRTYLLSSPTPRSVNYAMVMTTIATMLLTPRTQLVYLVPQSEVMCRVACEISRLPRAGGSGVQVLPLPLPVGTEAGKSTRTRTKTTERRIKGSDDQSQSQSQSDADVEVDEVVKKIMKYTKARSFDGYITFEDDRDAWSFLERVGKGVKCAAAKKREKA